ncbi:MAG: hypothetical protein NTX50_17985 [Candidatus Sumerlaeota bacterium]|nr:hypothetical protein [Candidatus Sumerlaeota bacterium]
MKKTLFIFAQTGLLMALSALSAFQNARADDAAAQASSKSAVIKIPMLVMPIEYSDCKLTLKDEDWNRKIFSTPTREEEDQRFDLFGFCGTSVNNYYKEITCGKFQFVPVAENCGTPNDGVIRISLGTKHPLADTSSMTAAVSLALAQASRYMNASKYDLDKNKALTPKELVIVVISAGGEGDATYSRNRTYYSRLNFGGCRITGFVAVSERRDDLKDTYAKLAKAAGVEPKYKDFPVSVGTLVHELGHEFGTPDVPFTGYLTAMGYGQKNARTALFPGTKMEYKRSSPSHYGAYTMVKAGFIVPIVLEKTGVYTVNSAGTGKYNVYKIPTKNPKEYFLIENRQQEGSDLASGVAGKARKPGGIALWHINEAFGKNDDKDKQIITIEEASEKSLGYSFLKKSRSYQAQDPFYPLPGNAEFSSASTPNNKSYAGDPQPWTITDFSASGSVMTFKFTSLK